MNYPTTNRVMLFILLVCRSVCVGELQIGDSQHGPIERLRNAIEALDYRNPDEFRRANDALSDVVDNLKHRAEKDKLLTRTLLAEFERLLVNRSLAPQKRVNRMLFDKIEELLFSTHPDAALAVIKGIVLDGRTDVEVQSSAFRLLGLEPWSKWESPEKRALLFNALELKNLQTLAAFFIANSTSYLSEIGADEAEKLCRAALAGIPSNMRIRENCSTPTLLFSAGVLDKERYVKWLKQQAEGKYTTVQARDICIENLKALDSLSLEEERDLRLKRDKHARERIDALERSVKEDRLPLRVRRMSLEQLRRSGSCTTQDISRLEAILKQPAAQKDLKTDHLTIESSGADLETIESSGVVGSTP